MLKLFSEVLTLLSLALSMPATNASRAVAKAIERLRWTKLWIPFSSEFLHEAQSL